MTTEALQPLTLSDINKLTSKYNAFVNDTLEPRLTKLMKDRDVLLEEIESYEESIHVVLDLIKKSSDRDIKTDNPLIIRKLVDVGCGVACQAETTSLDVIIIHAGIDYFVELPLNEAAILAEGRQKLLCKRVEFLDLEISDCVSDIEETLSTLAELKRVSEHTTE